MDLVQNKVGSMCKLRSNLRLLKTRKESSDDRPYHLSPDWYLEVSHWSRSFTFLRGGSPLQSVLIAPLARALACTYIVSLSLTRVTHMASIL